MLKKAQYVRSWIAPALALVLLAGGCRTAPARRVTVRPRLDGRLEPSRPVIAPVPASDDAAPPAHRAADAAVPVAAPESLPEAPPAPARAPVVEKPVATPAAAAAPAPVADGYLVQPGDSLKIEVYQEPDISRIFKVAEAGTINHPLLGKVTVAGQSLDAVETRVRDLLAADYLVDPKVIVTLERWAERPVIVFGEVRTPGVFEIPPGEKLTLLQLVARAGGFTDIAAIDKVRIIRPAADGEETIRVRVSELLQGKDHKDVDLQPGDVMIVPRTIF
ncbi:MAG: polysaccharide export protein [Lentisphaerae bacterium]|nr:polysaccharide export protein [Lentisphaerota bacterium]